MKHWTVYLPITGVIPIYDVVADTEEDAIDAALELERDYAPDELEQLTWSVHRQIVRGNVFNGEQNEAMAEVDYDNDAGADEL